MKLGSALTHLPEAAPAQKPVLSWPAAIVATLAAILLINPVGFIGGGNDDWQYLNAARCWAEFGPCLPKNHWQGRWPVIAPLAAAISLFGENRFAAGLPSLIYAIGCLLLLARLGNRLSGPPVGYVGALLLLVMPTFGIELLDPNAEHPELFFLLAAANFIHGYVERRNAWLAFAAGLSWSLAFQVRETAIAAVPLLGIAAWLFARSDRRALCLAAVGAAVPVLAELGIYQLATGDPLWRRGLSVAHTQIPSTELVGNVDQSRMPLFNPDYIAGWRQQPGIYLHWSVDGFINVLVNPMAGLTIPLSVAFAAVAWRRLQRNDQRFVGASMAVALYWAAFLIYVLAIDPKPRMMFVPSVLSALALAALVPGLSKTGSAALAVTGLAISWLLGMTIVMLYPQLRNSERAARQWAARYPDAIETDITTERHLTLEPAAGSFADLSSSRPMLAVKIESGCQQWATIHFAGRVDLIARSPLGLLDEIVPGERGDVCLFRYRSAISPAEISAAKASEGERVR